MTIPELNNFITFLIKSGNAVYGPVTAEGRLLIEKISDPARLQLDGQLTDYPWRRFFLPAGETLFNVHQGIFKKIKITKQQVLIGVTVLDLRALDLYNQVFTQDAYYQERKRQTIVIGQSLAPADKREFSQFQDRFQENVLEHFEFDIFLERAGKVFKVYTGSEDGQRLLEKFGYGDYEHVKYAGPILETGRDPEMLEIKKAMEAGYNEKLWKELGRTCLACGKCTLACPTCYCFNIDDYSKVKSGEMRRRREWSACFFPDFSRIAGNYRFLSNAERRIYYWYEHKFVRDPARYQVPGCARCGRCIKACPVGIDIVKNVERIKQGK